MDKQIKTAEDLFVKMIKAAVALVVLGGMAATWVSEFPTVQLWLEPLSHGSIQMGFVAGGIGVLGIYILMFAERVKLNASVQTLTQFGLALYAADVVMLLSAMAHGIDAKSPSFTILFFGILGIGVVSCGLAHYKSQEEPAKA